MNEEKVRSILIWISAIFLFIFCLFPFVWMLIVSLTGAPDFLSDKSFYSFTLKNYEEIIFSKSLHFMDYLMNSIIVSSICAVLVTFFASLSAYAVSRFKFPGRMLIPAGMLALSMFPQISIIGYLFKLMIGLGWINTYSALIFPYISLGMPLALWIMLSYFSQLPDELDKAGLVDGATRFQVFNQIILPLALPGAFATGLLIFIVSFNEFLFALMLTVDYRSRTIPVGIALFQGLHGRIPWGSVMAGAVIASIPIVVLAAVFQKQIVQGLTKGAIKG